MDKAILSNLPLFLWGLLLGAPKKEPGPSCEGPGMIRSTILAVWAWRRNWPQLDADNAHGGVNPWGILPWSQA
jgi:hypothetical protein